MAGTVDSVVGAISSTAHQYGCQTAEVGAAGNQTHGTVRTRGPRQHVEQFAGVGIGSNAIADGLVFGQPIDNVCVERNVTVDAKVRSTRRCPLAPSRCRATG
jgi:hypothetical protein